jgi:urease accessory protein
MDIMDTTMSTESHAMMRLWQMISPALPVGAYAYSGGLESAVQEEWISDEEQVLSWIEGIMSCNVSRLDIPVLARLYYAWKTNDPIGVSSWNRFLQASRESAELLAEDSHLGQALARLLGDLEIREALEWKRGRDTSFATMFALACVHWGIPLKEAAHGYLWAWCENQVAAAIKLVPLGQTSGQRLMSSLLMSIPAYVENAFQMNEEEIGMTAPALAIASARHETQYSRLFRS